MNELEWIAFDADDTLWHNETLYQETQQRYYRLMTPYADEATTHEALYATEMGNLARYGYGIKSFMLSMIETAVSLSGGRVSGAEVLEIIRLGQTMLAAPVRLLPEVETTVRALSGRIPLMVITKGDLRDQEVKLDKSGLGPHFDHVEIVTEKTPEAYRRVLERVGVAPARFMMVGNSLRSDVLPVLELGGRAVYVPYHVTWAHEQVAEPAGANGYLQLEHLAELPGMLDELGLLRAGAAT